MSLLLNLLWMTLGGGILIFFGYLLGGVLLCITIIGLPAGIQCIKLSVLALTPFGKKIESGRSAYGAVSTGMNILWIVLGGLYIAVAHLLLAVVMAITIIGIPFATQHVKMASFALVPFGKCAV
jgi:uncharacterized membrane protein YccF (DUF307 family)